MTKLLNNHVKKRLQKANLFYDIFNPSCVESFISYKTVTHYIIILKYSAHDFNKHIKLQLIMKHYQKNNLDAAFNI